MSNDVMSKNLSGELKVLAENMVTRVQQGSVTLATLESKLMELMNAPDSAIAKNPDFILLMCKYFRGNINKESQMILDLALSIRGKMGLATTNEPDNVLDGTTTQDESLKDELANVSAHDREQLRRELSV